MATRLENLSIEEVSGVDSPANELPGWIVQKAKDNGVEAVEKDLATLYGALASSNDLFKDAPEELVKARALLETNIEALLADEPEAPAETLLEKMKRWATTRKAQRSGKHPSGLDEDEPAGVPEVEPDEDDLPAKGGTQRAASRGSIPGTVSKEEGETEETEVEKAVLTAEDAEVLKEAIFALADRCENIEKALTGSAAPEGQETETVEKADNTIGGALVRAAQGERITLR